MTQRYLILEGPDTALSPAVRALRDALHAEPDLTLTDAGGGVFVSAITDRAGVLGREEGRTFPAQWGFTHEECLARTQAQVAGYVRKHADTETLADPDTQAWLALVDAGRAPEAAELFDDRDLFEALNFHWDVISV